MKPWRKLRPPMGPSSPAQNMPASGDAAEAVGHDRGVVVGLGEHVRAPPVAGEQQGGVGRRPTISWRRSSPADAASRTWNWAVAPTSTMSPTAIAPLLGVGADDRAHEEVAAVEVELALVDHPAEVHAARQQAPVGLAAGRRPPPAAARGPACPASS